MSSEKSEFGKGLTVNLIKFFEHFSNNQIVCIKNIWGKW
jgi:hypothetical protein